MVRLSRKAGAVVGTVALLASGIGVAYAAIPDSTTGEITGCRVTGDAGNVRIIDKEAGKSCHAYETEVSWPSEATEQPHVLIDQHKKAMPGGGNGGFVSDAYACPEGYAAVSVSYDFAAGGAHTGTKFEPQTLTVNPDTNAPWTDSPRNYGFSGYIVPDSVTGGAAGDLYIRGVCMTGTVSDGMLYNGTYY